MPRRPLFFSDERIELADVVFVRPHSLTFLPTSRRPNQIWILELLESPLHTIDLKFLDGKINYTASYRSDSDILAPYGRFVPFESERQALRDYSAGKNCEASTDSALGKTRKVAWFVSNCFTRNRRRDYASALARHIQVDVYGSCGNGRISQLEGRRLLRERYKFYLAFENSNCRDYVSEKLFENALL